MKLSPLMLRTWGLALAAWGLSQAANDYSASYSWNFTGGNLISNWSFENLSSEVCKSGVNVGVYTDCRFADPSAKSGSFVFRVNSQASGESYATDFLACEPSTLYSISYYVDGNWANRTGTNFPVIQPFKADKSPLVEIPGPTYESQFPQNTNGWKKVSFTFTTAADANWIKIILARSTASAGSPGNTFKFDNVLVTRADGEEGVVEARTYGDAAGRVEQTVRNDGSQELVSMPEYDDLGRVVKEYLPATAMRDFPYDLTAICVGTRLPGEMLEYDAATIQEVYNKLKVVVSQRDMAGQPLPILNIVVSSWGALAPLRNQAATLSFLRDRNQTSIGFQLKGILRYSAEYNDLVSRHGTTASAAGPYGSGTFQYMHSAQYSGIQNAWTEYAYPEPGVNTINRVAVPGEEYALSTNRTRSSGWALVETDAVPNPVEVATVSGAGLAMYQYAWSRDPQGKYNLSWKNREGRLVKTAEGVPGNWLATTYDYDSYGRLLGTNTPGGMFYDSEYDGLGQVTASIDPDRGRMEYLYDKRGQLRFSRPGGDVNNMIGTRYDTLGRALGTGKWGQTWAQSAADNYNGLPAGAPDVGYIYDELVPSEFLAQAGVSLTTVGLDLAKLRNGRGRLVASFNRNPEATIPGMTAAERKLVASFYDYDAKGRIQYVYRYFGSIEATADRLQKIKFVYDQNHRLESRLVFKNYASDEATSVPSSESYFIHDGAGRIVYVLDKDSRVMVQYEYNHLEQMVGVTLYDKIKIGYQYDLRGALLKIEAITVGPNPEHVFTEELGYHHKPNGHANIPELPEHKKRWDGKISSILKKFSKEVANAVEVSHFEYDVYGRLYSNGKYVSTSSALNGDGSINFGSLAFNGGQTEGFWYGADGQITSRMGQGGMFNYEYRTVNNAPTHQVANVGPALRQTGESMSATGGNFLYDSRGRMYRDVGLNKNLTYGYASDQPTKISIGSRNFHMLYNESYNRVAELEEVGGTVQSRKTYLFGSGLNIAKEIVQRISTHPLGPIDLVKNSLQGKDGLVGFEQESDGQKKLVLKDHLGSSVKVFDEATGATSGQEEYGYSSYGILEKKVTSSGDLKPSGTFTGKEYNDQLKLYYFGARWYDPELGMWISGDPAAEFFNPYSYVGANVFNSIDPFGLYSWKSFGRDVLSVTGTVVINVAGIGGCIYSSGQVCAVGYYDHGEGEIHIIHGGIGPVSHVGEVKANWRTNEFQIRGGAGGLTGGTTYNFGRTRADGVFFDFDITMTADFANPSSPQARGNTRGNSFADENSSTLATTDVPHFKENRIAANALGDPSVQAQMVRARELMYEAGLNEFEVYNEVGFGVDYIGGKYFPRPIVFGSANDGRQTINIPMGLNTKASVHIHPSELVWEGKKQPSGFGPSAEDRYLVSPPGMPYVPGIIIDERTKTIFMHTNVKGEVQVYPGLYEAIFGY